MLRLRTITFLHETRRTARSLHSGQTTGDSEWFHSRAMVPGPEQASAASAKPDRPGIT